MKTAFLFCLLAVTFAGQVSAGQVNGGIIDRLVVKALEFVRSVIKKTEPYPVPALMNQKLANERTQLTGNFYDLKLSDASNFVIKKIQNNPFKLTATFQVLLPSVVIQGKYDVNGVSRGKKVSGKGQFRVELNTLDTQGFINLDITPKGLRVNDLDISYTVANGKFNADGLTVQGLTTEQINKIFADYFASYVQQNSKFLSSQIAQNVKDITNNFLSGKSVMNVVEWITGIGNGKK